MNERRVAYVIGFAAPPVLQLDEFIRLLQARGWDNYLILSATAATWVDVDMLAEVSEHAVRVEPRAPPDQDLLPPADVVFATPLTFNSLNKWALGISDTFALGLLNEAVGFGVPVTAAPCINDALRRHPAYVESVQRLRSAHVTVLDPTAILRRTAAGMAGIDWLRVLAPLRS